MKKNLFLLITCLCLFGTSWSQTNTFPASGNVGIGANNPGATLEINTGTSNSGIRIRRSTNSSWEFRPYDYVPNDFDLWDINQSKLRLYFGSDGKFGIGGAIVDNSLTNATLVGLSNGYVGIGVNNPGATLEINTGTSNSGIRIRRSINSSWEFRPYDYVPNDFDLWDINQSKLRLYFGSDGKFGIGGSIVDNSLTNATLVGLSNGNVGIGATNPGATLEINTGTSNSGIRIRRSTNSAWEFRPYDYVPNDFDLWDINQSKMRLYFGSDGKFGIGGSIVDNSLTNATLVGLSNGSVGIGTSNTSTYKLAVNGSVGVNGTLYATQMIIQNSVGFPDYVFDKNYKLKSIAETEAYIKANNHLPDVPSADEVKNKGIDVSEMNTILLKKIEEMTLLMIEQNKTIEVLKTKVDKLEKK